MIDWLFIPVALLYFLISGALFLFGVNFIYLSLLAWREGRKPEREPTADEWPAVTVQLPIYNELYVAERVIEAAARLDYPPELLQIQVLDDSTDETVTIVSQAVARAQTDGVNIVHLHRTDRTGFKAGALQEGLASASGDFVAIFDADFVPPPHFLKRALPHIMPEPEVAFVQTRWGHLNRDYSWLTFLQSLAIDAHFMVEQFARSRGGYWFNFNGTAGIWRRQALLHAGGWTADTLTEDLDLSYRAYLKGWQGRYARHIEVPAELPVNFSAFRQQQHRWARGSLECALKLGAQVWQAPIPLRLKAQASLHLAGYGVHLLLFLLTLLYPLVVWWAGTQPQLSVMFGFAYLFSLTSFAPTLFFIVGQQQLKRPWWRRLPQILVVSVMGSGMMLNTVRAALQILSQRKSVFARTAKFGIRQRKQKWTQQRYQLQLDAIVIAELVMGLFNMGTVWWALQSGNWGVAAFALLFGTGLILVAGVTVAQALAVFLNRRARQSRTKAERQWLRSQWPVTGEQ